MQQVRTLSLSLPARIRLRAFLLYSFSLHGSKRKERCPIPAFPASFCLRTSRSFFLWAHLAVVRPIGAFTGIRGCQKGWTRDFHIACGSLSSWTSLPSACTLAIVEVAGSRDSMSLCAILENFTGAGSLVLMKDGRRRDDGEEGGEGGRSHGKWVVERTGSVVQ